MNNLLFIRSVYYSVYFVYLDYCYMWNCVFTSAVFLNKDTKQFGGEMLIPIKQIFRLVFLKSLLNILAYL